MPLERPWDEEAAGMPDPLANLRHRGVSPYGPEGEILGMGQFAGGVRRATGWRPGVGGGVAALVPGGFLWFGVGVAALFVASFLGSAVVSVVQLAGGDRHSQTAPTTVGTHLP